MLKDSGDRQQFTSGAVRDISNGKGRCDLLPLGVLSRVIDNTILGYIDNFIQDDNIEYIYDLLSDELEEYPGRILDLSIHFEKGALKYEERNWEKGIPIYRYIDSGVRHYLKYLDGQEDEDHYIAFIWNMLCLIWTYENIGDVK